MNPLPSLINSRKFLRVVLGIATVLVTLYFTLPTLATPEAKMGAIIAAISAVGLLFGVDVHAIGVEDAAKKSSPQSQVNVGSEVVNPPAPKEPPQ